MIYPGDIISYLEMCSAEKVSLQRGMNFHLHPNYSVILMSVRKGAPYEDRIEENGRILIYEGHDIPKMKNGPDPKKNNQELMNSNGSFTQNGLFFCAARKYKEENKSPELIKVYEKIKAGIWVYNGIFKLKDAWEESSDRKVFKFRLEIDAKNNNLEPNRFEIEHTRLIPSSVKLKVWRRDKGQCVRCGKKDNLHFDHIIPYSKGGSSLIANNIQLLCARHNLEKKDNIN